ncbi:hypothetical protein B484DRAFT_457864 [Ochromonadaceae sp. CCMP2298]|nr:hypothetical protein B484DRAFT_457864 [Ochromonadaceae sp. CCMP2298]
MKLGSLVLRSRAQLSPLESVSDVGFRNLCAHLGAALTWTEMIRAQAVCRNNNSALDLIDTIDDSTPTGIQLLAKTPQDLQSALLKLDQLSQTDRPHFKNLVAVDLNFGCPSPSIIREGAGPALLKRKKRLGELFSVLYDWKQSTAIRIGAVGCKIRLGLTRKEASDGVYLGVAELAAAAGLDYITVHARHAGQRSSEAAHWAAIRQVKELLQQSQSHNLSNGDGIKVIGNGDALNEEAARSMMEQTSCDGVMIARGAIRNPWIFRDIRMHGEDSGNSGAPTEEEVHAALQAYLLWAGRAETKHKFTDFHVANFARLAAAARAGVSGCTSSAPFSIPKNNHMS